MYRGMWLLFCCVLGMVAVVQADDWPQWRGPDRDGVWRESGIVRQLTDDNIKVLWRQEIGAGYCGPTVADRRVFVMDRVLEPEQRERILCFDSITGKQLWKVEYPCEYRGVSYTAGPRASVTIDGTRAYALGTMGHLHCLDAWNGEILWKRDLNADYNILTDNARTNRMPIWGIAAAPLIYDDLLILHPGGRDDCSVVALDKKSGQEEWRALDDRAQYSAPIVTRQGGKDVLVIWTGDSVAGLAPRTGKKYWRFPFTPRNMPIGVATPAVDDDQVFVTSFYDGSLMLRMNDDMTVDKVWQASGPSETRTKALHSIISTPIIIDDYIYGVDSHGELRCLEKDTGKRVWEDLTAVPKARWSTIHFVKHRDQVWMFTERGDLIQAKLTPEGYEELGRVHLIDPTEEQLRRRGGVCWAHPAFADRCIFVRNDREIICVSLKD